MNEEIAVVDAEPIETHNAVTLFGTDDPIAFLEHATRSAEALAGVLEKQKLFKQIGRKRHVLVEGWTLLGSMLGVFPVCVWTHKLEDGWEARVEARTRSGEVVGAAEAECLRSESMWKSRDDYALRSMAQTRATSKALRQPLGFVVELAGFNATPAEEMPGEPRRGQPEKKKQLTLEEATAELRERQKNLARLDKNWTQEQIFSQASAELGIEVKKWISIPPAMIGELLRKARAASSGIEENVGVEEPTGQFNPPEGPRGSGSEK